MARRRFHVAWNVAQNVEWNVEWTEVEVRDLEVIAVFDARRDLEDLLFERLLRSP